MRILLLVLLAQPAACTDDKKSTCVTSKNYMNAQYTVEVAIGTPPQILDAVPDTGSFELILASEGCSGCAPHRLFKPRQSTTFHQRAPLAEVETNFGQGRVVSQVHYDHVAVGSRTVSNQSLLTMQTNELRGFAEASYDAVMGLGMQTQARSNDTDLSLMSSWGINEVAICYGQKDGDRGRLQLGGGIPGLEYMSFDVIPGAQHWALKLDGVKVGGSEPLGCATGPHCSAILDSGTSLIAVPKNTLDTILNYIGDVNPDCSNIDSLPTITLQMGRHTLQLPPQLYVAKLKDVEQEEEVGWGMFKYPFKTGRLIEACLPLFMEMDMTTALTGDVWILGMPFLRAYSAVFNRAKRTVDFGQIELGSDLCTTCDGAPSAGVSAASGAAHARHGAAAVKALLPTSKEGQQQAALRAARRAEVKPSVMSFKSLMLPTWVARHSKPVDGSSQRMLVL